jgi:hypothetical protein
MLIRVFNLACYCKQQRVKKNYIISTSFSHFLSTFFYVWIGLFIVPSHHERSEQKIK